MTTYLGIDPGLGGAIAYTDSQTVGVDDTPTVEEQHGKRKKRVYLEQLMVRLVERYASDGDFRVVAAIEKAGVRPGEGVSSCFSIGYGYGLWRGMLAVSRIPTVEIQSKAWKKEMLVGIAGDDKDASRRRAMTLFPTMIEKLSRKKDHGRAEALLIAEYARRKGL